MKIYGHVLPEVFMNLLKTENFDGQAGSRPLINNKDSYGHYLETELGQVYVSEKVILQETDKLSRYFKADGVYGEESEWFDQPGFINDITDFSGIISFAASADDSPFCFDYRNSEYEPEIIVWDDVYWRRISPDFHAFIKLFQIP